MFSILKPKKISPPPYESIAKNTFSNNNLFVYCMREVISFSPRRENLLKWLEEAEQDNKYSQEFYLHAIRSSKETFTLNYQTKDYLKTLLDSIYLINKCSSIVHSNSIKEADYLINELVDVVYLLEELDASLRKGVPLVHKTVMDAVNTVHQLLNEKFNMYFQLSTESLYREIQIAKQLRLDYQTRKDTFKLVGEKQLGY